MSATADDCTTSCRTDNRMIGPGATGGGEVVAGSRGEPPSNAPLWRGAFFESLLGTEVPSPRKCEPSEVPAPREVARELGKRGRLSAFFCLPSCGDSWYKRRRERDTIAPAPESHRRADPDDQGVGRQTGRRPHQPRRLEDHQPHAPRVALCVQGLFAVPAQPQGDDVRLGPQHARSAGLPAGGGVWPADGRAWLVGRDGGGQRDHGGGTRRCRPRAFDGPEYPPALRAVDQPDYHRRSQVGLHEVFLHPQADVRQGERRLLLDARRLRHLGRGVGGADAAADGQARHDARRAAR